MWARLVVRGCWAVQIGVLPRRTLCERCLRTLAPSLGGGPAPSVGGGAVSPVVVSERTQPRSVHNASFPLKIRLKKKFRYKNTTMFRVYSYLRIMKVYQSQNLEINSTSDNNEKKISITKHMLIFKL